MTGNLYLLTTVVLLIVITLIYKIIPYREPGSRKPRFVLMPKYRLAVDLPVSISDFDDITRKLKSYGFNLRSENSEFASYTRGHILGDFSIKLAKISLKVSDPKQNKSVFYMSATWVAAFDTGDFWVFLNELKRNIEA